MRKIGSPLLSFLLCSLCTPLQGISDEILEKIKRFRETKQYQDGLGVGIQNAIERLEVLYEGKAELKIGRDRPNGTRVELILERKEKGDA